MAVSDHVNLDEFMAGLVRRNPGETEFHQAVYEVAANVFDYIADKEIYPEAQILRRIAEPDRIISFASAGKTTPATSGSTAASAYRTTIRTLQGWTALPPSVNQSILKFLAFEQTFKQSAGLPMGGGKGGADFNPKGKSSNEVMRFCQSFMTELHRHVGEDIDVPAGDIGVGAREIGYLFGRWKRLSNRFTGVLTGKGLEYGGSPIRTEATGYGTVYMLQDMLKQAGQDIEGKTCLVSGSGNVATYAIEKINQLGGKVLTASDSSGYVYDENGIDEERLAFLVDLKKNRRGRISAYADQFDAEFFEGQRPWSVPADIALPCATQNEISQEEARTLIANGCKAVSEGANMPTAQEGIHDFVKAKVLFAPSKAANAGGVAISGLEMSQNSARITWEEEELQKRLRIMADMRVASSMAAQTATTSTTLRVQTSPVSSKWPMQ